MATIRKQFVVAVPVDFAWRAIIDVGALHTRLVAGFVVDTRLAGDTRTVTFANGMTVEEKIIAIDDEIFRLAYTATGGRATHHNASVQATAVSDVACEITWITDLLPHEMAEPIAQMVELGCAAMKRTLEQEYRDQPQ